MNKLLLITTIVLALVGCNKEEPVVQPGRNADSDAALHQFLDRKTKKVRTIAEIEADEKAKEAAVRGAKDAKK